MRILYLIDKLSPGGAQRHLSRLTRAVRASGIDVRVCCLEKLGLWGEELLADGIPVTALDCPSVIPPNFFKALNRVTEQIDAHAPDIFHCLLFSANFIGPLAARRSRQRPAVIVSRKDTGFWMGKRHAWALRLVNRWAEQICCNSQAVFTSRLRHEKWSKKRRETRVSIIPNAVEPEEFPLSAGDAALRASLGIPQDAWVLISIARARPEKGHPTIIRAAGKLRDILPDLWVLFVGDGPELARLKLLATECKVAERIVFTGHRDDIPALLATSDVAVLASDSEGLSNFILEAMASRKPVIASAVAGNCVLVKDQETGLLFPPRDPAALVVAIQKMYTDKDHAATMSERGRQLIEATYSPAAELDAYLDLYDSLLKEHQKSTK